jgi:hypothetical protein
MSALRPLGLRLGNDLVTRRSAMCSKRRDVSYYTRHKEGVREERVNTYALITIYGCFNQRA